MSRRRAPSFEEILPALLRGRHLVEPPPHVIRLAVALAGSIEPKPGRVRAWLARLVFDSSRELLPVGLRRRAAAERRLLFEISGRTERRAVRQLDLRVRRLRSGPVEVTGHLFPPPEKARLEIRAGRSVRKAEMNELGEFLIRDLPAASRGIVVRIEARGDAPIVVKIPETES
jgi:hypothetical protein